MSAGQFLGDVIDAVVKPKLLKSVHEKAHAAYSPGLIKNRDTLNKFLELKDDDIQGTYDILEDLQVGTKAELAKGREYVVVEMWDNAQNPGT